jgi:hypothetical protein
LIRHGTTPPEKRNFCRSRGINSKGKGKPPSRPFAVLHDLVGKRRSSSTPFAVLCALIGKRNFATSRCYVRKFLGPLLCYFAMIKATSTLTMLSILTPLAPGKPAFGMSLASQVRVVSGVLL